MKNEPTGDIHTKTDQLLDLTQAMLVAAKSDNWDAFALQEQQRSAMLQMVFDNQTPAEESVKLHLLDVIKEIQLLDKAITDLIIQQRNQTAEELRHLKRASKGNKAYQIAVDDSLQE